MKMLLQNAEWLETARELIDENDCSAPVTMLPMFTKVQRLMFLSLEGRTVDAGGFLDMLGKHISDKLDPKLVDAAAGAHAFINDGSLSEYSGLWTSKASVETLLQLRPRLILSLVDAFRQGKMVVDGAFNGRDVLNQDNVMWSSLIAIDSLASNHLLENPTQDWVNT